MNEQKDNNQDSDNNQAIVIEDLEAARAEEIKGGPAAAGRCTHVDFSVMKNLD